MSRSTFIVGLIISVALHMWLMRIPAGPAGPVALPQPTMIVPVVETELAQLDKAEPPTPEPAPEPIPETIAQEPPPPDPEPPVEEPLPNLTKVAEAPPGRICS